jgi:hypothetical protein
MKLNSFKSLFLEEALDAILLEWENKTTETIKVETNNYTIEVDDVFLDSNSELKLSFKVSSN